MLKATPSQEHPDRCAYCGQLIYPTQTARGTELAHVDSKMLFCTADPVSSRWQAVLVFLVEDCGLDAGGTETLIRLAVTAADSERMGEGNPYVEALRSFSEPSEVNALATGVAKRLYAP